MENVIDPALIVQEAQLRTIEQLRSYLEQIKQLDPNPKVIFYLLELKINELTSQAYN